jgi:uncharacterized membrane protein YtjA (UPF0391 family)
VLLMVGILIAAFGGASLVSGRQPVIAAVLLVVGLVLTVVMRVHRSRAGRWP